MADVSWHDPKAMDEQRRTRVRSIALALREGARDLAAAVEMVKVLLEAEIESQRVRPVAVARPRRPGRTR